MEHVYQPDIHILQKYAKLLVHIGLGTQGQGLLPGETVLLHIPEQAKPMLLPLQEEILRVGANPLINFIPDATRASFFQLANDDQLKYFPSAYHLGRVADIDHQIALIADADKHELESIDPAKIMMRQSASKFLTDAYRKKEQEGNLSMTLGLYGTKAMADEVRMTVEEYWKEIITACSLDLDDPIAHWQAFYDQIQQVKQQLNSLPIERLHIKGVDVDLKVQIGRDRKRLGGSGRNIPSFETFISPDRRGTSGRIKFNQPLYRYGSLITGIELEFADGVVVDARATQHEDVLKKMIQVENADKIGEFSLTDKRFSKITRFMGETLFDENVGGPYGNTHIALGMAYKESYPGNITDLNDDDRTRLGYNDSVIHTDVVSTSDRIVVAHLTDGSEQIIYQDGMFSFLPEL